MTEGTMERPETFCVTGSTETWSAVTSTVFSAAAAAAAAGAAAASPRSTRPSRRGAAGPSLRPPAPSACSRPLVVQRLQGSQHRLGLFLEGDPRAFLSLALATSRVSVLGS